MFNNMILKPLRLIRFIRIGLALTVMQVFCWGLGFRGLSWACFFVRYFFRGEGWTVGPRVYGVVSSMSGLGLKAHLAYEQNLQSHAFKKIFFKNILRSQHNIPPSPGAYLEALLTSYVYLVSPRNLANPTS